ncbi:MAG TPA: glycosyltransferase, partial [Stellaceae bacterium]|nr:glycosyltransferase [Stellaceae bacterium]
PETYWPMAWFWRAFGKVFIFDYRDLSPELAVAKFGREDGAIIKALLWLEKMTFQAAQLIVATNESYKKVAMDRGKMAPEDIFIVRSAPSLSRFHIYGRDPKHYKGKPHLIAYLGEICQQDGVENLVRAVKVMRDEMGRDDFHCILIGGGPHQPSVVEFARQQGVADICTFTGIISDDELCRVLSSAEIGIDPVPKNEWSDRSTMNKILEYMFFGLPVVAFALTEAMFSAQKAGLFVEPNSEHAMAKGIAGLLDDPERRRAMSEFGQQRLRSTVAFEYSIPPLLACYERAWAKGRGGRLAAAGRAPVHAPAARGQADLQG